MAATPLSAGPVRVCRPAALIAESDGSTKRGREHAPWHTLAIFASNRPGRYVVSIQFFLHPSKEPVWVSGEVDSAAAVAVFFLAYDPAGVLEDRRTHRCTHGLIRRAYELQVHALLADFRNKAPLYSRA